ncbi:MAG: HAMP domain-containing protein, partial [Rhodospirillales bacterium]
MTIGSRISLGFGALIIMLGAVGFIGWSALNSFNHGVAFTQQLQEVGRYFGNADRSVRNFINTSEDTYLDEADRFLLQAINRQAEIEVSGDDALAQKKILEDNLKLYQEKVAVLRKLSGHNRETRQAMLQSSNRISEDAASLVESETSLFQSALENLTKATEIRATAKDLKDESEKLLRATLAARVAQTEYIETNLPSAGEKTADSIKDMFLSALRLKKLANGQPVEEAAASVASHVGKYRQAFAALSTAIAEGQTTYEIEQNLISESGKVSSFTEAFAKNISNKSDSADQIALFAQGAIKKASVDLSLAMHVVAEVQRAKTAQTSFQYTGDPAEAQNTKNAIASILTTSEKLSELTKNTDGNKRVVSMLAGAGSYLTQFEEYAGVRLSYSTVRDELFGLQEDLTMRTNLAILTEVNLLEKLFESSSLLIIAVAIGSILAGMAFAFLIARSITRPIGAMTGAMQELADGNLEIDIPGSDRKDEIAAMAGTVQVFKDNSLRVRQLQADQEALEARQKAEQKKARLDMADGFETSVSHIVQSVSAAATELQATAEGMSHSADQATRQSDMVAGSAEQAAGNVSTVAAAAEELSSSIAEISRQVTESSNMTEQATREADQTDAKVK